MIGATALGPSALEAETLLKMALLLGPARARDVLSVHGGVIVHDKGEVETVGLSNWQLQPAAAGATA